ncbi:ATP-binding cassette sub-family C member 10-like [Lineus longissimus]|uniref:ATP-binding cassette sub-family C member 10-like n=1 Tax=Lineus longissimus TaxID=88925 RepID=UPI00315C9148
MDNMNSWSWSEFCGTKADNFTVWSNDDFNHCFELLVLISGTNFLLAVISIYHLAKYTQLEQMIHSNVVKPGVITFRLIVTTALVLAPVMEIILSYVVFKVDMSLVSLIASGVSILTWLFHIGYLWKLRTVYIHRIPLRGPTPILVSYALVLAAVVIELQSNIRKVLYIENPTYTAENYVSYVEAGLHFFYLLSLIPIKDPMHGHYDGLQVQYPGESGESQSLLGRGRLQTYGSITPHDDFGDGYDGANIFNRLTFCWVRPLLRKGAAEMIHSADDLYQLPKDLQTRTVQIAFRKALSNVAQNSVQDGDTPSTGDGPHVRFVDNNSSASSRGKTTLLRAMNRAFGLEYYSIGILKLIADLSAFAGPILLNLLVSYIENKNEPSQHGYFYACGLFLSTLITAVANNQFGYLCNLVGLKIRASIITTVYYKTVSVSMVSLGKFTTGEIVNFMSTDTDRIVNFAPSFHQFWSLPFQVAISLYLLYRQIGLAFLAGLGFAVLLIPINRWIAVKIGSLSKAMMEQKDGRVKVVNEVLNGIRVIKFYALEETFMERINRIRIAELSSLRGRKYLDALCVYFWATTPVLISILSFTTYALMGNTLTAAKVFTSLALFNILIMPLNAFPWVINGLMEAWVSLKRLEKFMKLDELDLAAYYSKAPTIDNSSMIRIKHGAFSWHRQDSDEEESSHHPSDSETAGNETLSSEFRTQKLEDINISVKKGQLVGIVGKVGSGKSSLLAAILAEMTHEGGSIEVTCLDQGFGYTSQEAWIQHATIRENIIGGAHFDVTRYQAVIEGCALIEDLKILPAGDQTEVGENGVTLSGGQKARVGLARAIYQDKEIYLLDDPFAAVDIHVAQHIFSNCIMGILRHKTRLLCTHQTQLLKHADLIIVLEEGRIIEAGPPSDILGSSIIKRLQSVQSAQDSITEDAEGEDTLEQSHNDDDAVDTLVEEEEQETGVVRFHVYQSYWKAVGACLAPAVLLSLFLMQGSRNINDWWLSYWVSHAHHPKGNESLVGPHQDYGLLQFYSSHHLTSESTSNHTAWTNITSADDNIKFYLTVYGCLAAGNSLFTLLRAFLFAYGGICAAKIVHSDLLKSILQAPITFFDTTPIGRILNRFSSDVYAIDDTLPFVLNIFLAQFYGLLGTVVITCYGLPWFLILLVPLGAVYIRIQSYYRKTSRELKRITSVTLSPIYAHFSESVTGLMTIRALRQKERFIDENERRLDLNQRAQFSSTAAGQWFDISLQSIGVSMVTGVAFIAVLEHNFQTVDPGLVGLAISYALMITGLLNGVVTFFSETEKQMVSMERAKQYTEDVPCEKLEGMLYAAPFWPLQGVIEFNHVVLQYRRGLPNALNSVTFETKSAEKIGIVGRTGSGKSSLFLSLYRMVELTSGWIMIDGLNVSHLGLHDLRSRLAIIPQDPFLFSGTVRENLDPSEMCQDIELWEVLGKCHMKRPVERLGGLDAEVAERGKHFSLGQRQLICLARALLTRAKVLCMDEATASVDHETDQLIQRTIKTEFSNMTVLTIAHRINTVLESDRVLVMDNGKVAEFGPPQMLLDNPNSMFSSLVRESAI